MHSPGTSFRPWIFALVALVAIELTYYAVVRPPREARNSFLDLGFAQEETFQRLVAYDKIMAFADADPDIIQVGDSSGLHGVQPHVVMSHIPGFRYLNLGVATNLGYKGYYDIAKLQLERSPNARYLVVYTSPFGGFPRQSLWDGNQKLMAVGKEFRDPFHRLFQLPTLAARHAVTDGFYYFGAMGARGGKLTDNRGYLAFDAIFRDSNGWTRETDVEGDIPVNIFGHIFRNSATGGDPQERLSDLLWFVLDGQNDTYCEFRTLGCKSYFEKIYGDLFELAKDHGVRLIVVWNPLPETVRTAKYKGARPWDGLHAQLVRMKAAYPDVVFTDIEFWPDEKFSVFSHVATPHSGENSHRVGRLMKDIIGQDGPVKRTRASRPALVPGVAEIDFRNPYAGYGWTEEQGTTNKFPLQYVGPRNRAWVYMTFPRSGDYRVRATFRTADVHLTERMDLKANDVTSKKLGGGEDGDGFFAEWLVSASAVAAYNGWMVLEFDMKTADAGGKRTVSFQRISARPVEGLR